MENENGEWNGEWKWRNEMEKWNGEMKWRNEMEDILDWVTEAMVTISIHGRESVYSDFHRIRTPTD